MTNMNIRPAFRYRLNEAVKGAAIFFGVMILVTAGIAGLIFYTTDRGGTISGSFSGFGISAAIAMLITGICTIREDLRLMLQNGVGRRTVFAAEVLVILIVSLLLAVAGELLIVVGQAATSGWQNFYITDLFQIAFFSGTGENLSLAAHLECILCFLGLYTSFNLAGIFCSLLFYRLNKMWTIIVAVGTPLFFFVGLPVLLAQKLIPDFLISAVGWIFRFAFSTTWAMLLTLAVTAALIAAVNWLLLRRAPVKPVK